MFEVFKKELSAHSYGGYHRIAGPLDHGVTTNWFQHRGQEAPSGYTAFLAEIGPGIFFGGALTLYPLFSTQTRSVDSELTRLRAVTSEAIFPFGYDGTTESCYCLEGQSGSEEVYWFSWEEKVKRSLAANFHDWIESQPRELFQKEVYAAYKQLTNVDQIVAVMEERSAFRVRLVAFEKQLQRPPDKPNDFLPRYHKVVLEVTKTRSVTIPLLTVGIARLGSKIGADNVEYVSFPVQDLPVNGPTSVECFAFDPFNVPFTEIGVVFNPVIDLGSKRRVRFKEISSLLA